MRRSLRQFANLGMVLAAVWLAIPASGQSGQVVLQSPNPNETFEVGQSIAVFGRVVEFNGTPIEGAQVTVRLLDPRGASVPGVEGTVISAPDGSFVVPLYLPANLPGGTYTVVADALDVSISDRQVPIRVRERFTAPTGSALAVVSVGTVVATVGVLVALHANRRKGALRRR